MALSPSQQAQEFIARAENILVVTRERAPMDAIASAVAAGSYLKNMGKRADIVAHGFDASTAPAFLTGAKDVRAALGPLRALEISVDVSNTPLGEFTYDVRNGKLEITVIPKEREWSVSDLAFRHGKDRYDLIVALDAPDMNSLGASAHDHADFFHRTPVIAIDHAPSHEHWGQVNIVDVNAVSTTEVLHGLMMEWNRALIDGAVATALLTGMIAKTRSFRRGNVTPRTLSTASQLIGMGARREEIVSGLWRTRSVSTLKLWGRALARLHHEPEEGLAWTVLAQKDFFESGGNAEALDGVFDELIAYAPEAKVSAIIAEDERDPQTINVTIAAAPPYAANELGRTLGAEGTRERANAKLRGMPLADAAHTVVEAIKKGMRG